MLPFKLRNCLNRYDVFLVLHSTWTFSFSTCTEVLPRNESGLLHKLMFNTYRKTAQNDAHKKQNLLPETLQIRCLFHLTQKDVVVRAVQNIGWSFRALSFKILFQRLSKARLFVTPEKQYHRISLVIRFRGSNAVGLFFCLFVTRLTFLGLSKIYFHVSSKF